MSFQNKNKKEFENVYHKNKFNVYRIAMDYSGSHKESAEEIFQEVFLKLYTHFDTVDEEYMAAWLVTTTKNTAINYMKKRARECPKADIELFSDLYSKEYAESAEEHVFHKILQKEKVGYGWTILDALMHCTKKMKTGTKQSPWFTVWRENKKMWLNLWGSVSKH